MRRATRSPAPRPFWKAMTTLSGSSSGAISAATSSTENALVAITHTLQGPASWGERPTLRLSTTKLPLAPETVSPEVAMVSMCSCHLSMAHTSCPALPRRPAYTEPMAPVPTTAIFMRPRRDSNQGHRLRRPIPVPHVLIGDFEQVLLYVPQKAVQCVVPIRIATNCTAVVSLPLARVSSYGTHHESWVAALCGGRRQGLEDRSLRRERVKTAGGSHRRCRQIG